MKKTIEDNWEDLTDIVKMPSGTNGERKRELQKLAVKVGATHKSKNGPWVAQEAELVAGIQVALQTKSMLNACASAEKSGKIAMWSCIFAAVAAIAACISIVVTLCLS